MSRISKYLQINENLLLEYSYDTKAKRVERNRDVAIVKDNCDRLMYFENPLKKTIKEDFKKGLMFTAFPENTTEDSFFYAGHLSSPNDEDAWIKNPSEKMVTTNHLKEEICSSETLDIPYETVRVYISTGYTFNELEGFIISVKAKQSSICLFPSSDHTVVLSNFVFHKNVSSSVIKFAKKPFYMTSRFYDRYIEFQIPSAYNLAQRKRHFSTQDELKSFILSGDAFTIFDALSIDNGKTVQFDFVTIEENRFIQIDSDSPDYVDYFKDADLTFTDRILYNQGIFHTSKFVSANVVLNSDSDNFNLRLFEDKQLNCIRYYPVWGDVVDDNPITRKIMNSIENGSIKISLNGFLDENDTTLDDFESIYGENARHWIIVNQLELEYHYMPFLSNNTTFDRELILTRKFNYTEDFEDDNDNIINASDIYKFVYRPIVETLNNGYSCRYINVTYTGRLVNRLNGEEVVRVATLQINDAESKFGQFSDKINVSNIYKWKLFNKIESEKIAVNNTVSSANKTKYVTKFVNNLDFTMVDEDGLTNTQGKFIIKLFDTEHLYKMRLFEDYERNKVFSLGDANVIYMLRVTCGSENTPVYIKPTYSSNMNSIIGELEFKITEDIAKKILQGDMKWHIVSQAENGITTLFAGKFKSVFDDD